MGWVAGFIAAIALAAELWWYVKRARRLSAANDARHDFQRDLLLDLQDIRHRAESELAPCLDELIDIARYDTPASNEKTAELDAQISSEVRQLAAEPSRDRAVQVKELLVSRNHRAKR